MHRAYLLGYPFQNALSLSLSPSPSEEISRNFRDNLPISGMCVQLPIHEP